MDPVSAFGLISGGIQVLQAIGSTVHGLNQLYGRFKDADLTIQSLIQELNCIGTALASLKEWIRLNSSTAPQPEEYNNDLAVALEGCRVVMDVVSRDVSDLVQSAQEDQLAVTGLRVRMKIAWNEETMKGHQEKLRAQVIALQLLLQVCQCRTSTEQVRLLRKATTRRVFDRVADDTATVLSSRGSSYAGSVSQGSRRSFSFSDREADFNNTLARSPVYLRAGPPERTPTTGSLETQPTIPSGNRSPFTDEGYASNRTQTSLAVPSLDIPIQQEGLLALPSSPSGPVHNRSVSHTHVPTQSTMNTTGIRRNASDSKVSSPAMRASGSKLERIASSFIGRINTRSRANLAASPGGSSTLSASPSSGRRRHRLDGDLNTSIDLTSDDALPQIIKAAQSGSRDEVERLIERGSDIEARHQRSGRNALLVAAHCGRDDVIDLLIQHNARLAVVDRSGDTALHLAASRGHCGVLMLLLPECDLIEIQDSKGRTPLRVAADYGQSESLDILLANHSQVNGRAENQMTALHAAAKRGDEEIVQLLVSHSADLEAKDGLMMTALHYACGGGHLEVIKLLLDHRANIEAPGDARKTPLICAAEFGRSKAVELLLKRKASTRATDEMGMAAIHWAAYNGHHEALRLLSEKKGSLDLVNNMGRTALHLAAMQSQFAVVELLQRKGVSLDRRCKMGLTALHYACMADSLDITSLLLLTGADIEAVESEHQQRPLHIVAVRGSVNLLDFLCDKGASLTARNGVGDRALCVASRYGHVAAVQRLLDRESPLCLKFDTGFREDSPLCLAAMGGHWPVISLLLARGASVLKKDETGWSALRYAAYHGHADVLQLLLSNSSLPETDVPEVITMPETIGFSRDVPEENKHRVQGVLAQALGNRYPNPLPNHNRFSWAPQAACSAPFGSLPGTGVPSLPVHFPFEADSSTPQELPGSLDQDLTSNRSISPDRTPNNSTGSTSTRQLGQPNPRQTNEANPPVTNARVTASLEESRRASQPREQPFRPRDQPQPPRLSATYSPIPSLREISAPTPSPPLPSVPYRTRNDHSTAPSIISSSGQSIEAVRIPRTLPAQSLSTSRDVSRPTSHSEDQAHDSGSDTDSISSVYTAPEGCEPDEVPTFTLRAEIEEAAR